ncbi:M14 family zinc carboxypeptidase [Sphingobacterium populi]|uniref:M14 family zinc carboxypeptidase n=1 Tax=Sphingobacterium sp. CFCC 11742 TaxID=1775560 RepID=UPI000B03EF81|nr:M14 family zinc carboxypeptidase [Sphingobacterium sp. CFCC 11742]
MNLYKNTIILCLAILSFAQAFAQKAENILAAAGSPANPKVPISWNRYHDNTALLEIYRKMASAHPDLVNLESIGKSVEGRDLWLLTISDKKKWRIDKQTSYVYRWWYSCQ